MKPKVLLIGAAGRIAQWVIPYLAPNFELILTDREAGQIDERTIRALDITDYDAVLAAMKGVDMVVHLAIASSREIVTDLERFNADEGEEYLRFNEASIEVNVRGTYHVFEAARAQGVTRVVYGSSLTVFLGQPRYPDFHDSLPSRPANFYAVTKMWGENLGEYFSRRHGLKVYCLRFGTPYPQPNSVNFNTWMKKPVGQRSSVTFRDLAWAVECALTAENGPAFGCYSIVSSAENSLFDCSAAAEIGWKSQMRCEADGGMTLIPE